MQTSLPSSPSSPESNGPKKQHCDHQTDCLKMIQLLLDGEATEAQKEKFRLNMDMCMPCIKMYHLEKEIKDLLQGKMEKKCCPESLVESIKAKVISFS